MKPKPKVAPDKRPKFDRNAYQRDYMRKRRAADKAKRRAAAKEKK